ncbi:MAG: MerR family transcriptional regulator [Pseudomonadota bacterium]
MTKSADAFRTISEVAEWLNTPAHVLRFWESKFSQVKPVKRAGGRRYYRPADMKLLGGIKRLLHDDGMTIKGVQKLLREEGIAHVAGLSQPLGDAADDTDLDGVVIENEAEAPTPAPVSEDDTRTQPEPARPPVPADAPQPEHDQAAPSGTPASPEATYPEPATEPEPETEPEPAALEEEPNIELSFSRNRATKGAPPAPASEARSDATGETPAPPDHATDRTAESQADPEPGPEDAPDPPAQPAIVVPDLPEDPDDDMDAAPGVLSRVSALRGPVSPKRTDELLDLARRLRGRGGTGNGD